MMLCDNLVVLRPKLPSDASSDYSWQTNTEFCRLNNKAPLRISFHSYLAEYSKVLDNPPEDKHEFAIDTKEGLFIGNCAYYDRDDIRKETEVGITIGERDYWGKGYGYSALKLLLSYIFSNTDLKRVYLKTLTDNKRAHKCFAKCYFSRYGRLIKDGKTFILMELDKKDWQHGQCEPSTPASEAIER